VNDVPQHLHIAIVLRRFLRLFDGFPHTKTEAAAPCQVYFNQCIRSGFFIIITLIRFRMRNSFQQNNENFSTFFSTPGFTFQLCFHIGNEQRQGFLDSLLQGKLQYGAAGLGMSAAS
jgi:hypothetical protein